MSDHPYPEHVLDAVEEALRDKLYEGALPVQLAETALQAIWDASRVDTLGQVDQLPDDAILWGADDMEHDKFTLHVKDVNEELHQALPAHVIFWGDTDA